MLSSRALSLPNFSPKQQITQSPEIPISPNSSSTQKPANSLSNHSSTANTDVPVESGRKPKKASAQLKHWSRARAIRSGRGLHRQGVSKAAGAAELVTRNGGGSHTPYSVTSSGGADEVEKAMLGVKSIYIVSDGTGWTAENSVNAALGQFEHCLVDRGCPVNTHLFSGIEDAEQLIEVIKQAAKEGGMLVYTLADPSMAESARNACRLWGVPSTDVLGPITEAISAHLDHSPLGLPRGAPGRNPLTDEYFRRIEAIEFTIKQDDGALPQNLDQADIILTGVSRTGKTPLSIYLAQKGYKVANVPIVMGVNSPETLFQVDPKKVFGLTINQVVLQTIRTTRAKSLGFNDNMMGNYSKMDHVRRELEHAAKIFAQNPTWPVIEVTGKAIEETAAIVLRLYQDRKNKCSMPSISKRY